MEAAKRGSKNEDGRRAPEMASSKIDEAKKSNISSRKESSTSENKSNTDQIKAKKVKLDINVEASISKNDFNERKVSQSSNDINKSKIKNMTPEQKKRVSKRKNKKV